MSGFDPYDALAGRRVPGWARSTRRTRQALIQLRKRVPINLAPVLGIEPRVIAKAQGCRLTSESRLQCTDEARASERYDRARELVCTLGRAAGNCGGGAWGYEFDVQTRWTYYPAGSPNLIATVFVGRGLAEAGLAFGVPEWSQMARDAAAYVAGKLRRQTADGRPFFAYTPGSLRLVHNANLLGAGLVAALGSLYSIPQWCDTALEALETTTRAQRADGSWAYGEGDGLGWSDNFHTAYNLDGLLLVWLATGDSGVRTALDMGTTHWVRDFFGTSGEPKYYPSRALPYDIHSAATAVDVAARLATWGCPTDELANRVARWTEANLLDPVTALTYFQKHRFFVDRRNFVRWGEAHWALGRSSLALLANRRRSPLEAAVEKTGT